jgi:hypothetical protein
MSARSSGERSVRNCLTDEGRPLGVGLQERASNRLSAAMDKSHGRERERKRPSEDWVRCQARKDMIHKAPLVQHSGILSKCNPVSWDFFLGSGEAHDPLRARRVGKYSPHAGGYTSARMQSGSPYHSDGRRCLDTNTSQPLRGSSPQLWEVFLTIRPLAQDA